MRLPIQTSLIYLLLLSLVLSFFRAGRYLLYPIRLFTTWVHECSHAGVALLMGGKVKRITLASDTSGLTLFQIPSSRIRHALVASSGYLGSSFFGCLLYFLSVRFPMKVHDCFLTLSLFMGLSLLFWIRNMFGALAVLGIGSVFLLLGLYSSHPFAISVLTFLSIQISLNAFFDIRTLFDLDGDTRSDAHTLRKLFYLPEVFWALLWMAISSGATYWVVTRT